LIKEYIKKLKASEAALPPEQRLCDEVLQNQILDKFVEFSGERKKDISRVKVVHLRSFRGHQQDI
jgi:hypothetical protein